MSIPYGLQADIPSFQLKIVKEGNGLVIREHISTRRYDGTPVDDSRVQLHVYTYQAMYNDVPVEVEDYCGGPDDYLIRTLTELVDDYNQRGLNPILQRLHGGSVFKDQSGRLHAYLVLSPREGTPWVKLVKTKQSIELLCQVAEKTAIVFKQLKQNKQMNFDDIRVRSDGTLLLVPHTEGENFLLDEDVFNPSDVGKDREYETGWPFDDLCWLLHESSKQGLVPEAVAALREHDGTWDQIAVWRVGRDIGLRPPPSGRIFNYYPSCHWNINPGWIIHCPGPSTMPNEPNEHFNTVLRLPKSMIEEDGANQWGRIVSESLPPDPLEYEHKSIDLEIEIEYVNMRDDWSLMIKQQREHDRRHKMTPRYSEETLEWSDWEMDVDQV
ncbi:hypothetical protein RSAG8_08012, partial [Rhizoctonia solani AG-8 WAC10335]